MLNKEFKIIDFTNTFENNDINKIYFPAQYGGHLTPYGNKIVAETLIKKIYLKKLVNLYDFYEI